MHAFEWAGGRAGGCPVVQTDSAGHDDRGCVPLLDVWPQNTGRSRRRTKGDGVKVCGVGSGDAASTPPMLQRAPRTLDAGGYEQDGCR